MATGPLRNHLFSRHQDVWIATCNKLGIQIKSLAVQGADVQVNDSGYPHKPFSNENFVDVLGEFIVGDDMVCHSCIGDSVLQTSETYFNSL